jgi:hypothetical protein
MASIGSVEVSKLAYREAWAFIGVKGQKKFLEKRGATAGTGAIMSYATVTKTTTKSTKVDGGSKIEVVSAGYKDGNIAKIILNGT